MADNESGWSRWARNGRLSAIVWTLTFVPWLIFKAKHIPLDGLDTAFVIISGTLCANLGISTVKPSASKQAQRDADKTGDTNA